MSTKLIASAVAVVAAAMVAQTAAASTGDRAHPYPHKKLVTLPEGKGWKLRVNSVTPNATAAVLDENEFNDKPKPGRQFYIINVTAVYTGKGSSTVLVAGSFGAVGKTNVAYSTSADSCGVIPDALDTFKTVFTGGRISGNICFAVKTRDVKGLRLYYEPLFSLDDTQVFFRLS